MSVKSAALCVTSGQAHNSAVAAIQASPTAIGWFLLAARTLLGAAETQGTSKIGAMIGARGCVYQIAAAASGVPGEFLVAVAWQGFNSTAALPSIPCGQGKYSDEKLRRVVALPISIANLASP